MNGLRGIGIGSSLVVVLTLLVVVPASAVDSDCPNGAVNAVTNNYFAGEGDGLTGDPEGVQTQCEICLDVKAQEPNTAGGWEQVARICSIRNDAQAHLTMFRIGKCGLIVPEFERVRFYGAAVPLRIEAIRQACR